MARWKGKLFSPGTRVLLEWVDEEDPGYRGKVEWEVPRTYRERGELSDPDDGAGINVSNATGVFPDKLTELKKRDTGVDFDEDSYIPVLFEDIKVGDTIVCQNGEVTAEFEVTPETIEGDTIFAGVLGLYFTKFEVLGKRPVVV